MTAIEKSYTEGLEGLETEEIKLRKGKIRPNIRGVFLLVRLRYCKGMVYTHHFLR